LRIRKKLCLERADRFVGTRCRIMGTSITQIDATYGHLVPDSEEYLRALLDAYDVRGDESTKVGSSGFGETWIPVRGGRAAVELVDQVGSAAGYLPSTPGQARGRYK
jgi:hypothetical protein